MSKTNIELEEWEWDLILDLIRSQIDFGIRLEMAREYIRLHDKIVKDVKNKVN